MMFSGVKVVILTPHRSIFSERKKIVGPRRCTLPGEFERYFLNCTYCLTVYFLECNSLKIRSASASFDSDLPPTIDDSKSKTLSVGDFFNNGWRSLESSTDISSSIFLFVASVKEMANCPVATLPANNVCNWTVALAERSHVNVRDHWLLLVATQTR